MALRWPAPGPTAGRGAAAGGAFEASGTDGLSRPPLRPLPAGVGQWRGLVCSAPFTWPCEWALAVIACESSGNPDAIGDEWYEGRLIYFYGLFQVWNGPLDPYLNTVEAHIQYAQYVRGQRPNPWPNCP